MVNPVHHLVGAQEIGRMLGVSRARVYQLSQRQDFPVPVAHLGLGKVWRTEDVEQWQAARKAEGRV